MRRLIVLLALVLPLGVISATPAQASAEESELISRTNSARASNGLRSYVVRSDLASVARRHAARMASQRRLYHNPNLTSEVRNWRAVGENVGVGSSASRIHQAFMSSSSHRSNILSRTYTEVGIGAARGSDGQLYVSEVFRRPAGATSYSPAPAPRQTVSRPSTRTSTRTTTTRRASRSAVRRPLPPARPVAVAPRRPTPAVNPVPGRLSAAWRLYRTERPASALDRAVTYAATSRLLAG